MPFLFKGRKNGNDLEFNAANADVEIFPPTKDDPNAGLNALLQNKEAATWSPPSATKGKRHSLATSPGTDLPLTSPNPRRRASMVASKCSPALLEKKSTAKKSVVATRTHAMETRSLARESSPGPVAGNARVIKTNKVKDAKQKKAKAARMVSLLVDEELEDQKATLSGSKVVLKLPNAKLDEGSSSSLHISLPVRLRRS